MKKLFVLIMAAGMCACTININGVGGDFNKNVRCGGDVVERALDLSGFDSIEVLGSADAEFIQGETFRVVVKANEDVFDYLDYTVEDGILKLATVNNVNIIAKENSVTITAPVLKGVTVKGAADLDMEKYASAEDLAIEIMGAGDIDIEDVAVPVLSIDVRGAGDVDATDLNVEELKISVAGAGDVHLSGKAGKASLSVSGAGDIDARGLECDNISTSKNGFASIRR